MSLYRFLVPTRNIAKSSPSDVPSTVVESCLVVEDKNKCLSKSSDCYRIVTLAPNGKLHFAEQSIDAISQLSQWNYLHRSKPGALLGVIECRNVLNPRVPLGAQLFLIFIWKKSAVRKDLTLFFKITWKPHQFLAVTFLFYPKVICFLCISKLLFCFVHLHKYVFCFLLNRNSVWKEVYKLLLAQYSNYAECLTYSSEAWERNFFILY